MMRLRVPQWLRMVLIVVVLLAALVYLHSTGGLSLLLVATIWPLGPVFGMQSGLRRASPEAWQKQSSKVVGILVYAILFSMILFPAIVALFIGRPDVALALAVTIILIMALILRICRLSLHRPLSTKLAVEDRMS